MSANPHLAAFLDFSSEVAAFTVYELQGTGQAQAYLDAVTKVVGTRLVADLLQAFSRAPAPGHDRDAFLRHEIFGDPTLGPIARNIIKLWYVGIWHELPRAWTEANGAREENVTFMVSAQAYTEGLLWPAIGAHPPGAKAPGYASWVGPPDIP